MDEDEPEARPSGRGPRASTVLTALLVALGLALPGVAVFLLRPVPPAAPEPTVVPREPPTPSEPAPPAVDVEAAPGAPPRPVPTPGPSGATAVGPDTRRNAPGPKLARLEPSLSNPSRTGPPASNAREAALHAVLDDPNRPAEERSAAALELLDGSVLRGRTRALARDAERIFGMDLPRHQGRLPAEQAGWLWVNALSTLDDKTKVPEAGEAFLRRFPDSALAPAVNTAMRSTAMALASEQRARRRFEETMRQLEEESEEERARLERRGEPTTQLRWELARKRCSEPATNRFHDVSAVTCRAFLDAWAPGKTPAERDVVRDARTAEIVALVGLHRYTEARARLAEFRAADPEGERQTIAASVVFTIPADAEE